MVRIKFNNSEDYIFALNGYSRNTNFEGGNMNSYIYVNLTPSANVLTKLQRLGVGTITDIELLRENDESIYSISEIEGHIGSIDESLQGDEIYINMNIRIGNSQ